MNKQNAWNHMTETDIAEGPIEKVTWQEMVTATKARKP